jgi:uncharacterized protein (DUF2384 family)
MKNDYIKNLLQTIEMVYLFLAKTESMIKMITHSKISIKLRKNLTRLSNRERMTLWKPIRDKSWVASIKKANLSKCNSLKFTDQKTWISNLKL